MTSYNFDFFMFLDQLCHMQCQDLADMDMYKFLKYGEL